MPKMKRFKCRVVETLVRDVEVYGKDVEDANEKLAEMYNNGDIVLTADDFDGVEFKDWEEVHGKEYRGEYE